MHIQIPNKDTWLEQEIRRASAALNCAISDLVLPYTDWDGTEQWLRTLSGGTADYATVAGENSYLRAQSSAVASSSAFATLKTSAGLMPNFIPVGSSGEWYISSRFKLETVPDAQTQLAGIGSENEALIVGALTNAVVYRAQFQNGPVVASTKTLDTAWNIHRLVRKSASTLWTINDADGVSANIYPTAPGGMGVYARNGSTAANQSLLSDWIFAAYRRV